MVEQTNKDLFGFNFAALANIKTDSFNNNLFDRNSKKIQKRDVELKSVQIDSKKNISGHLVTNNLESLNIKSNLSDFSTQTFSKNFLLHNVDNVNQKDLNVSLNQLEVQNNINNFKVQLQQLQENVNFDQNKNLQNQSENSFTLKNNSKLFNQLDTKTTTKLNNQVLEKLTNNTNLNALSQLSRLDTNEPLVKLNARVDAKDNSESFQDFAKKVFSKDMLKELGDFALDLVIDLGKFTSRNIINALIPSIDFKADSFKKKGVLRSYAQSVEEKLGIFSIKETTSLTAKALEERLNENLGIPDEQQDQSNLFRNWITKNPLLGQHQFNLTIKSLANSKITKSLDDIDILEKNLTFRVQGIKIPGIKRNVSNTTYGHSLFSNINNLQADVENKADLEIICDKNLDTLEYIIRLAGLGVCENFNENNQTKVYDLSTICDSNFNEESYNCAILDVYNGRDLAKAIYMENPEWEFEETGITKKVLNIDYLLDAKTNSSEDQKQSSSTSEKVVYAMLPQFTFENFKIVNMDYSFSFEAGSSAKLLKLKTTCTWSKMYINWVSPEKRFYDETVQNTLL